LAEVQQTASVEEISGQQDYYVNHLAEVNKSNDVVSTEDIFNKNGILIVRKGARISHDVANRILQHKLLKPLEQQVQLERSITPATLLTAFDKLCERFADIRQIHAELVFDPRFRKIVNNVQLGDVVTQKLSVLSDRYGQRFDNALFSAWLSVLIAVELQLSGDLLEAVYLAALTHDLGLLHIQPEIVNKTGQLSVTEWRAMQSHVVVGQMLLKNEKGMNGRAATAVLEHHERCDGSGYPTGKTDDQLDVLGQIVGITDSLHAIRINQFEKHGRNLRDALPYLHMNATVHFVSVSDATHEILKKSGLQSSRVNPLGTHAALVDHLHGRGRQLQCVVTMLDELQDLALRGGAAGEGRKLIKVVQPVVRMIRSSGLLRDEILLWLESLRDAEDQGVEADLTDMELMQNELYWQLKKVFRVLREYVTRDVSRLAPDDQERLKRIDAGLDQALGAGPAGLGIVRAAQSGESIVR
jgi:HD-GYP domain-containing protein (c-di-GMP phosphodiesterase class II)